MIKPDWLLLLTCHNNRDEEVAGMCSYYLFCSLPPQLIYMMATTYNFAVLKFKSREDCCTKF